MARVHTVEPTGGFSRGVVAAGLGRLFAVDEGRLVRVAEHVCPISHEWVARPVLLSDGQVYESSDIGKWLRQNVRSPCTNEPLVCGAVMTLTRLADELGIFLAQFEQLQPVAARLATCVNRGRMVLEDRRDRENDVQAFCSDLEHLQCEAIAEQGLIAKQVDAAGTLISRLRALIQLRRVNATIRLQAFARRSLARKVVVAARETLATQRACDLLRRSCAARVMQRWWRGRHREACRKERIRRKKEKRQHKRCEMQHARLEAAVGRRESAKRQLQEQGRANETPRPFRLMLQSDISNVCEVLIETVVECAKTYPNHFVHLTTPKFESEDPGDIAPTFVAICQMAAPHTAKMLCYLEGVSDPARFVVMVYVPPALQGAIKRDVWLAAALSRCPGFAKVSLSQLSRCTTEIDASCFCFGTVWVPSISEMANQYKDSGLTVAKLQVVLRLVFDTSRKFLESHGMSNGLWEF